MKYAGFGDFIAAKTPQTLHLVLNVPINTVYGWTHAGFVPRRHWPDILLAFPEVGLNDLLAMESARRASQDA